MTRYRSFQITLILLIPVFTYAEGTKEFIPPGSSGQGELLVGINGMHTFATATSSVDYRLYVHIKDYTQESINFGFGNASTGNPWYTVHRPDGTFLCTGTIPKTPGPGYISTYAQAVAGPFPLSGGYTPIQCLPDVNGDYYLEVHDQHPSGTHLDYNGSFDYFDLTVVDGISTSAVTGRVWSKCWQFDCGSPNNFNDFFDGKVYIYSADSIVTTIDFIMTPMVSGDPLAFIPAEWDLMCNSTGCFPIGPGMPYTEARRSNNTTSGYPEYKIFLNDPDSTIYPSGTFGAMIGNPTFLAKCDGTYDISMQSTKNGVVEVYIEVNPLDPQQNVTIRENVLAAPVINLITWDGLDGYGNPVPSGTPVTMYVNYLNGLTNFPITNVDINTNGFQVSLERPSGLAPLMYWDDQYYFPTLGSTNLTGCLYTNPGDCHVWDWRAFGHDKTINTWWYVASSSAAPVVNLVERAPTKPDSIAGPDTVCLDWIRSYTLHPNPLPDADANGYEWVLTDVLSGTTDQTWSNADTTISIDFSLFAPGSKRLKVRGSNAPCGYGPFGPGEPPDGIQIIVEAKPSITNSTSLNLCSQETTNILITSTGPPSTSYTYIATASSANLSGYQSGSDNPIIQTLINTGSTVETVTYAISGTNWQCPGDTTYLQVHVAPTPDVTTVTGGIICTEDTTNIELTSHVAGTTFDWIASGSSPLVTGYENGTGDYIAQQLFNAGFSTEVVSYLITPRYITCLGHPYPLDTEVLPAPDLFINPTEEELCSGGSTSIALSSSVTATTFSWTVTSSSPQVTGHSPGNGDMIQQTLTSSSYSVQSVTYSILTMASGCRGSDGTAQVTIDPLPWMDFTLCDPYPLTTSAKPIPLRGGLPFNGTYSGPGVSSGQFDPAVAGAGTHIINYAYTNMYGCTDTLSQSLMVQDPVPHTCGAPVVDLRDGTSYPTILIGGQCWMQSNLNFGSSILSSIMQRDNCIPEKYCLDDAASNCVTIGGLYQWDEMMNYAQDAESQGLCPPGWHLPSESEWNTLFALFYNNAFAGDSLKPDGVTGFDAGLNGVRFNNAIYEFHNWAVMYWSSSAHGPSKAWAHGMNTYNHSVSYYPSHRNNAFPVRCLKN